MKRIRISLTQDIFLASYKGLGIKQVFVNPGYEVERNLEVGFEPIEAEVTEDVYEDLLIQEVDGVKRFNVEDLGIIKEKQKAETGKAEEEYKARQKARGK